MQGESEVMIYMEFKLQEVKSVPVVFNYEEMKKELGITLKAYSNYVVDDKNLPIAKSDMAKLNKVKKALNDKKIEVKKTILQDYELFESQVKELMSMIDDGVSSIKTQTDAFEEERVEKKKQLIKEIFNKENNYNIDINKIYNIRWENKGYDIKTIESEIKDFFNKVDSDLNLLKSYPCSSEDKNYLIGTYFDTLDLNTSIKKLNEFKLQKNALEQQKQEGSTITLDTTKTSVEHAKTSVKLYSIVIQFTDSIEKMKKLKKFLDEEHINYTNETSMTYFKTIEVE